MLIRVLLPNGEEGLFNADCLSIFLLQAIRRKYSGLAPQEIIDLCSTEGHVKELSQFPDDNASQFFTERELCLVVKVSGSPSTSFAYTPLLTEYSTNQEFLEILNHKSETESSRKKSKTPYLPQTRQTEPSKLRAENGKNRRKSEGKTKKHRVSVVK